MKKTIRLIIDLDKDNIPEKIHWEAADMTSQNPEPAGAVSLSLWDARQKNTLRIDLWTREMPVDEMKKFIIDSMGGYSQSVLTATGDEFMSGEIRKVCDLLAEHVMKEKKPQGGQP